METTQNSNTERAGIGSTTLFGIWIDAEKQKPKVGKKVLVCGHYSNGNRWRALATWQPTGTIDAEMWDETPDDWWDEDGNICTNPHDVWFEQSVELETTGFLENVTHWMPLPDMPNVRDHRHRTAGATDAGEERASASGVTAGRCSVHRSVRAISFIGNGCSSEVDKSESALAQESPGQPEAAPPEHGRGWPPSERPDPISRESENDSQSCHTDQCKTLSNEGQQSL